MDPPRRSNRPAKRKIFDLESEEDVSTGDEYMPEENPKGKGKKKMVKKKSDQPKTKPPPKKASARKPKPKTSSSRPPPAVDMPSTSRVMSGEEAAATLLS